MRFGIRRFLRETLFLPRRWTARARLEPDFLVIGTQKAGTTSLYFYLIEHPNVAPAWEEEVHFFDLHYTRGMDWYRANFPVRAYRSYMQRVHGREIIVGESTPYYIFHPAVRERMARELPDVKLIVLLRNPIDRAYSQYQHEVRNGHEALGFEAAMAQEEQRLEGEAERLLREPGYTSFAYQRSSYLARGRYAEHLEPWYTQVPPERLLILSAEDFRKKTAEIFRQVTRFLGIPDGDLSAYPQYNSWTYEPMNPATRAELVEYFRPHNARLYELLGRDFGWDR